MDDLTKSVVEELTRQGAVLVGVGDLSGLPADIRCSLPLGISIAVKYPKEIISGISDLPTQEYKNWYDTLNNQLDSLAVSCGNMLVDAGYEAISQTRKFVGNAEEKLQSALPHKTVATRAGIGWIGKCALLVTEQYGSMIRLTSVLTNAPLSAARPINHSQCGDCMACTNACPAKAVSGKKWEVALDREAFFNAPACRDTAHERSMRGFGGDHALCGKCIEICPYTQKYIKSGN